MSAIDVLGLMALVRGECQRRGNLDQNSQMRMMSDARRKALSGATEQQIKSEAVEMLRAAGFYESDEERQSLERAALKQAQNEENVARLVNKARISRLIVPGSGETEADGGA